MLVLMSFISSGSGSIGFPHGEGKYGRSLATRIVLEEGKRLPPQGLGSASGANWFPLEYAY